MLHPAVKEAGILPEGEEEIAVQVAYTPKSQCFGCGTISYHISWLTTLAAATHAADSACSHVVTTNSDRYYHIQA